MHHDRLVSPDALSQSVESLSKTIAYSFICSNLYHWTENDIWISLLWDTQAKALKLALNEINLTHNPDRLKILKPKCFCYWNYMYLPRIIPRPVWKMEGGVLKPGSSAAASASMTEKRLISQKVLNIGIWTKTMVIMQKQCLKTVVRYSLD